jgi:hypothetical protein
MIKSLNAKHSIMVYDDEGRTVSVLYDKVDDVWSNARALSNDDLHKLIDDDSPQCEVGGFFPPNMLWYVEDKIMVWYSPPCIKDITVKKKVSKYRHPGLVFLVRRKLNRDYLSVAVVSKSEDVRPHNHSQLYELPYAGIDVHPSGGVMGNCNVNTPKTDFAYHLDWHAWHEWERSFYDSGFNYKPKRRNQLKVKEGIVLHEWINSHVNKEN